MVIKAAFVAGYSGGAVLDFHQLPMFSSACTMLCENGLKIRYSALICQGGDGEVGRRGRGDTIVDRGAVVLYMAFMFSA